MGGPDAICIDVPVSRASFTYEILASQTLKTNIPGKISLLELIDAFELRSDKEIKAALKLKKAEANPAIARRLIRQLVALEADPTLAIRFGLHDLQVKLKRSKSSQEGKESKRRKSMVKLACEECSGICDDNAQCYNCDLVVCRSCRAKEPSLLKQCSDCHRWCCDACEMPASCSQCARSSCPECARIWMCHYCDKSFCSSCEFQVEQNGGNLSCQSCSTHLRI